MLTRDNPYYPQVRLLVEVLPFVGRERCFALKGGTAINLFVRDLPRLSVDIDLAFVPVNERASALREIDAAFNRIKRSLEGVSSPYAARIAKREEGHAYGMLVANHNAEIKVEVSPVLRGSVYPESDRRIVARAEAEFGFAEVPTLSFEDLYAGKLVAALDRQHPRDFFDAKLLLEAEGISERLFRAFLVYLISHDGSLARLVNPAPKPIRQLFEQQFADMPAEPVSLEALERARADLIRAVRARLGDREKEFLVSFKRGEPRWELLGVAHAPELPAVRWKLHNLDRMGKARRKAAVEELEKALPTDG
jgi:predicted nucleotidyltransferase component of viral defense system